MFHACVVLERDVGDRIQQHLVRVGPGADHEDRARAVAGSDVSGVIRVRKDDYETVVAVGAGQAPVPKPIEVGSVTAAAKPSGTKTAAPGVIPTTTGDGSGPVDSDLLFKTVEKLNAASAYGGLLSEYDTRAEFIDKYLDALGYTEFGDVQRGGSVDSGTFPDYVLRVNGKPAIAIEAKKLGTPLGSKEAGQVVGYCSNLGVRWGAVTDGRYFKLYDAPMLGVSPEDRLVMSVNLADYKDRDDFEARVYPEIELIAKTELESGAGLERRVAQEAVRELLTTATSKTTKALRKELDEGRHIRLSASELSELVSELFG
jgi:hypothetical protein